MAVFTLKARYSGQPRVKVYPRIGGNARAKAYGMGGEILKVDGIALATDVPVLEAAFARTTPQWVRVPFGAGVYRWYQILVSGQPGWEPLGGGYVSWSFDGVIIRDDA